MSELHDWKVCWMPIFVNWCLLDPLVDRDGRPLYPSDAQLGMDGLPILDSSGIRNVKLENVFWQFWRWIWKYNSRSYPWQHQQTVNFWLQEVMTSQPATDTPAFDVRLFFGFGGIELQVFVWDGENIQLVITVIHMFSSNLRKKILHLVRQLEILLVVV